MATAKTPSKTVPSKKDKAAPKPARETGPKYGDPGNTGFERTWDLPWCDKKVALFKALKALKAFGPQDAKAAGDIATKAGISNRDVRHYSYHARASGLIELRTGVDGARGHLFYLTKKGQTIDPAKEFKEQEAAKGQKE